MKTMLTPTDAPNLRFTLKVLRYAYPTILFFYFFIALGITACYMQADKSCVRDHDDKAHDTNDAERQLLLQKNTVPSSSESSTLNGNGYGTTDDATSQGVQGADVSDTASVTSEDSYLERQRKSKEAVAKRLQEDGNWWTYIKGFSMFVPFIWPVNDKKLQFRAVLVGIVLLVSNALNVLVPIQFGMMVQSLITYTGGDHSHNIWTPVLLYSLLRFINDGSCLTVIRTWLWTPLEQYAYSTLSSAAHRHIMSLSSDFHDSKSSSDLFQVVNGGRSVADLMEMLCFQVIPMLIDLVIAFVYFGAFGPYMFLVLVVTFVSYMSIVISCFCIQIYFKFLDDAERLLELFKTEPSIKDTPGPKNFNVTKCEIEFSDVCFSYDERKAALKNVSFFAEGGKTIAFVGETGGGKSTMLKLMDRFYDVKSGSIKIDVKIFETSQCITRKYMKPVKLLPFMIRLLKFADGYNSKVGDRGVKLSGGEKQRVAIARAILKRPNIILLDEATSAVDTETEQKIQEGFRALCKGRTTFVVAHRLSTVMNADHIVVIMDGGPSDRKSRSRSRSKSPAKKEAGIINDLTTQKKTVDLAKAAKGVEDHHHGQDDGKDPKGGMSSNGQAKDESKRKAEAHRPAPLVLKVNPSRFRVSSLNGPKLPSHKLDLEIPPLGSIAQAKQNPLPNSLRPTPTLAHRPVAIPNLTILPKQMNSSVEKEKGKEFAVSTAQNSTVASELTPLLSLKDSPILTSPKSTGPWKESKDASSSKTISEPVAVVSQLPNLDIITSQPTGPVQVKTKEAIKEQRKRDKEERKAESLRKREESLKKKAEKKLKRQGLGAVIAAGDEEEMGSYDAATTDVTTTNSTISANPTEGDIRLGFTGGTDGIIETDTDVQSGNRNQEYNNLQPSAISSRFSIPTEESKT
ncbi:hypothetical protein DID88_001280 [Monilinia fructigena]|uniref:ABC transporter domain-containing protein n=1 Tax=Monilinia fructigena TaxID=38457 RepID=A0A395IZ86_9HELO|nr:hypothetical protein DID88_001280 [Monilinia fructigena]